MTLLSERVTLNPVTENPALAPLDLMGVDRSWGIYVLEQDYTPPELETQDAGGADTDGDPVVASRYKNRIITTRVRIFEPEDPASTSLVTNPCAALAATSWAGVSLLAGPTRVLPANTPIGKGIDTAVEAKTDAAADYLYHDTINVTNAKTYRASVYVQLSALTATGIRIVVYNAAGAAKKAEGTTYSTVNVTAAGWARLDVSFVADATAAWRVGVEQVGAGAATFIVTGLLVEESAVLTPYFSGDVPGCEWTGARHASTSTRPAPDGTRFSRIYNDLMNQLDRVKRLKTGTLRRVAPGCQPGTFDLRAAHITDAPQDRMLQAKRAELAFAFEADPGLRTPEVQIGGTREELTLPALIFNAEGVPGDLPGLGRLLIEEKQAQNQQTAWWGAQHDTYSASANAELFYQAESRTLLGAATKVEGPLGASGAGTNTLKLKLANAWQAIFSTQATGGGEHLSHVGSYRVVARVYRFQSLGTFSAKWQWATGDFAAVTTNDEDEVKLAPEEAALKWSLLDLGIVNIPEVPTGTTQRWEGRLLVKSTVPGDDVYVDYFLLIPVETASGKTEASPTLPAPSSFLVQDDYDQAAGALTGKAPAVGAGTYTLAGDAVGYTVGSGVITRTEKADAEGVGAYGIAGTTELANLAFRIFCWGEYADINFGAAALGGFVRYTDVNNHIKVVMQKVAVTTYTARWQVLLIKKKAGVSTTIGIIYLPEVLRVGAGPIGWITCRVTAAGEWRMWWNGTPTFATITVAGQDTDFNEAGTLKTGKVGVYDEWTAAAAPATRTFDHLEAWAPASNAAIFASRQLEVRSDQIRRQDSAGVTWGTPSYQGQYCTIPPAGPEKGITRILVKDSRDPRNDAGIDDIAAKLFVQPRYLIAPPT
jgi:hypothetical protein